MAEIYAPNIDTSFFQEFMVTNKIPSQSALIIVQQPVSLSLDTRAAYLPLPDGNMDISRLLAQPTLRLDETYTITSALAEPTIVQMRQAGTEYPDWVIEHYLQLPEDFPESIRELVAQLSQEQKPPYDKAFAFTNYLRSKIVYNKKIPAPPQGQDPIEWFLFTWKEGFCNYSASAHVVMLRAAGIPARLAVGFAEGERDEEGDFLIQQNDAHTWSEVYFPHIGWVEFEPTSSQTLLLRPSGTVARASNRLDDMFSGRVLNSLGEDEQGSKIAPYPNVEDIIIPEVVETAPKTDCHAPSFWGMIIVLTVVVFFGLGYLNRKQLFLTRGLRFFIQIYERNNISVPALLMRWMRWSEANPIARAFHGVNISLRLLGEKIPLHFTPRERAAALKKLLPEEEDSIQVLLDEHERRLFTPNEGGISTAQRASFAIRWSALKHRIKTL